MKRITGFVVFLSFYSALSAQQDWHLQSAPLTTRWAKEVSPTSALPEYPRPQMVRTDWQNLNGLWDYAITDSSANSGSKYDGQILVPYPIESALSGVKRPLLPSQALWYHRKLTLKNIQADKKYLLHFGAVDYDCRLYVNGKDMGTHTGGFQSFTLDISAALKKGDNELTLKVLDPTEKGNNPKGKQILNPQGIMYTASSGIWQTVWLESVPKTYIDEIFLNPDVDRHALTFSAYVPGDKDAYQLEVSILDNGKLVTKSTSKADALFHLEMKNARLWSPEDPFLYDLVIRLVKNGKVTDEVKSYFGMRKISIGKDSLGQERIFLNNKYYFNLGVLDQGFWPDGLLTAPTDEALAWDIKAIKSMGFNTIRKHIKVEPARWYYHCDKLGMLVWQDMVYPANLTQEAKDEFEREADATMNQLMNVPSIVTWVLFNEGWNKYDQERLTTWMKEKDPYRLVNGHTGENYDRTSPQNPKDKWINSDMTDVHTYPGPNIPPYLPGKARVLGEWGGVRVPTPGHQWNGSKSWGYIETTPAEFKRKYTFLSQHLKLFEQEGLSASIYTQPFDVEIEENGLITYDREIFKIPVAEIKAINAIVTKP